MVLFFRQALLLAHSANYWQCDPQDPCAFCPKGKSSDWELVGCNRGTFRSKALSIGFCPVWYSCHGSHEFDQISSKVSILVHRPLQEGFMLSDYSDTHPLKHARECWIAEHQELGKDFVTVPRPMEFSTMVLSALWKNRSIDGRVSAASINPLTDCILGILWDLKYALPIFGIHQEPHLVHAFYIPDTLRVIERVVPPAAIYQAKIENVSSVYNNGLDKLTVVQDQLIAQSLICLRNCLEVVRMLWDHFPVPLPHMSCDIGSCDTAGIRDLNESLNLYTDELWQVFFKKENLRSKEGGWLSTFYSLCIQSVVRKALLGMAQSDLYLKSKHSDRLLAGSKQYLYLPLRLFIASSGKFDPLIATSGNGEDYREAQRAVGQLEWASQNITGSADYLRRLFEDDGETLQSIQALQIRPDSLKRRRESSEDTFPASQPVNGYSNLDPIARNHPFYKNVSPQADGLCHCPWEKQSTCQHMPEKLRCNYEYVRLFPPICNTDHLLF